MRLILTKDVEIKVSKRNIAWYKNRGINCSIGEIITVHVADLSSGSHAYIDVLCDYCNKNVVKKKYKQYLVGATNQYVTKDCCNDCKCYKTQEINEIKYGVKSVAQLEYFAEQIAKKHRHSFEYVKQQFEQRNYILVSNCYANTDTPLEYICKKHEDKGILRIRFGSLLNGNGCRYCGTEKATTKLRNDFEMIKQEVDKSGYKLLTKEYKNSVTKMNFECPKGHRYKTIWSVFKRGGRCGKCSYISLAKSQRTPLENIKDEFRKINHLITDDLNIVYKNNHSKFNVVCDYGHVYTTTYARFQKRRFCYICSSGINYLDYQQVKEIIESVNGYKLVSEEYKNAYEKLNTICPNGHQHDVTFYNFNRGQRCRQCSIYAKPTVQYVQQRFIERGLVPLFMNYASSITPLEYSCPRHCDIIQSITFARLNQGQGCRECGVERAASSRRLDEQFVFAQFAAKGLVVQENEKYQNDSTPIKFRCSNHTDVIQEMTYMSIREGHGCKLCCYENRRGENSNFYIHGQYPENKLARGNIRYFRWRDAVYKKDNYTCQRCGYTDGKILNAHHLDSFSEYPDKRYDIDNGITLCRECHLSNIKGSFHSIYGTHKNTKEQFEDYMNGVSWDIKTRKVIQHKCLERAI